METTIKINSLDDFNINLFTKLVKDLISEIGSVEISIRPKVKYNNEILKRINEIERGDFLYSFSNDEFEQITNKISKGETINLKDLKKVKKNEKGNFVSA